MNVILLEPVKGWLVGRGVPAGDDMQPVAQRFPPLQGFAHSREDIDIDDKVRLMGAAEHMLIGLIGEAERFLQIERKDLFKLDLETELAIDKIKIGDRGVAEYIIEIQVDRSIRAVCYISDLQSYLA